MYCCTMRWVLKNEPLMAMACCMTSRNLARSLVHRKNHALQLGIKRFGFGLVISGSIAGNGAPRFADAPSGDPLNVAFHPPAVENTQTWHAVQRGLHAAGAGSFERKLRRVEPEVHAGSYLPAELKIVVVEENHGYCFPQRFF